MRFPNLLHISLRYPKTIILFWTLFVLMFSFSAPKLSTVLKDHGLFPDGSYAKVQQILSSEFHFPEDPVILVFEKKDFISKEQFQRYILHTLSQLHGMDGLTEIITPLQREGMLKGNFAYALLAFQQESHKMNPVLADMQTRLPMHNEISVNMTGKAVVQADVNQASKNDLKKAEWIGITAAFIILWLAFGGLVSAMIPIFIGVIGVSGTMGMMYWLGQEIELSNFVLNVIPMAGLALSIDFALVLVSRFREELHKQPATQALVTTMQTAGRAVLFSALSVFLGLTGILLIPLPMFSSIALGAMMVLTVSVLLSLTLVPSLLFLFWRAILAENKTLYNRKKKNVWHTVSLYVMRRPVRMGALASILLICWLLPLSKMELAIPDATSLPQGYSSRQAFEAYQTGFVSPNQTDVYIVVQGRRDALNKEDLLNIHSLVRKLQIDPDVDKVDSIFSSLRQPSEMKYEPAMEQYVKGNQMLIQVTLKGEPSSKEVRNWLRHWEGEAASSAVHFLLGGEAKYQQEVFDAIFQNIKYVLLFILVSNYIVLFIAFRSILIPLKTIAMNLLSLGASFGILSWIFREGQFGIEPGSIAIMIPVFIFGLVFGISMDYGVFMISRIFEIYQETRDNDYAVQEGLASIARIISSAAAIMIAVTVPFAFGEVIGVKQLGIGIAIAIFIDATVIRMILVPSLMKLLGKWNWWAPGVR